MTNEMKLKLAKLEADGYIVEIITNNNTDKWDKYIKEYTAWSVAISRLGGAAGVPKHPYDFITTDFKVSKKESLAPLPIQSKEWGCIVDFVQNHREDIINDINDYGGLGFVLDFMERNNENI